MSRYWKTQRLPGSQDALGIDTEKLGYATHEEHTWQRATTTATTNTTPSGEGGWQDAMPCIESLR